MGFFGGDSSTQQTTYVTNKNTGADNGAIAATDNAVVNVLDAGAIGGALELATASLELAGYESDLAFDFANATANDFSAAALGALDRAFAFANDSLGLVGDTIGAAQQSTDTALSAALGQTSAALASKDEAQSGGAERLLMLGGLALAALVFVAFLNRGKK